jgi:hypothetical protein
MEYRWLAVLATISGCFVGAGPTIAMRTNAHAAVGWQANLGIPYIGVEAGQSIPIGDPGSTAYIAASAMSFNNAQAHAGQEIGARGALGVASGEGGEGALVSAAMMGYRNSETNCSRHPWLAMLQIGVRALGTRWEMFMAPVVDVTFRPGDCT